MKLATITLGLPASGKTTWAKLMRPDARRIERDLIRQEIANEQGSSFDWSRWDFNLEGEVHRRWKKTLAEVLQSGQDIVLSDTNLNGRYRRELVEWLRRAGYRIEYVLFDKPVEECRQINATRGPFAVDDEAYKKLEISFYRTRLNWLTEAIELKITAIIA